jgi:large subunit ribosomal protein L25
VRTRARRATSRVDATAPFELIARYRRRAPRLQESRMSEKNVIIAEQRTEFGKGHARRVRRAHKIPVVLYGHGAAPVHLTLPGHQTMLAVKLANAVLTLEIDGKEQLALVKDIQRDAIKPVIDHMDLVLVRLGEKVTVDIPVSIVGEAAVDTVVNVESQTLSVAVEATHIPESIEISVEGAVAGTQIHAGAVVLPEGAVLEADADILVVNITAAATAEEREAELAEAEAEAGIEHEPHGEEATSEQA